MWKIKFISLLFLALLSVPSLAQIKIGVTGGLNISQIYVSDDSYKGYVNKIRPGFTVGPTLIYRIPKTGLGFDVSALFDNRGAKSKTNSKSDPISVSSLQFPVNVRYGIDFGEDMLYCFVFTGLQYGVNIGKKEQHIISGTGTSSGHELERCWVNQGSAFSLNFGIGGIVMEKVQIRVSYNLALRKSGEIQQTDLVDGSTKTLTDGKANACQIVLSYLF